MTPLMIGPELMRHPQVLFGLGLLPEPDKAAITFEDADGGISRMVLQEESHGPTKGWPSVIAEEAPLYLRNVDANYWFDYVPTAKLLFFQYNVVHESDEPLWSFLDRLFRFVEEHEVDRFVIDLRWNTGGTRLLVQQLIHRLIRNDKVKRPGKLFVVVGRHTVSAGMMLAAEIERNTHAVFVGEPTGSSPNFVGQDVNLRLPFSGMTGSLSDLYWQNSAATDFRVWIAPSVYTPPSFPLFKANRAPALEAILAYDNF